LLELWRTDAAVVVEQTQKIIQTKMNLKDRIALARIKLAYMVTVLRLGQLAWGNRRLRRELLRALESK
jgi:hypothetical protein